jgi:hypothetical protein
MLDSKQSWRWTITDQSAIQTLFLNNKGVPEYEGDVKHFFQLDAPARKRLLGRSNHVQVNLPYQGFSGANRNGGANNLANNELYVCSRIRAGHKVHNSCLRECPWNVETEAFALLKDGYQVHYSPPVEGL